MSVPIGGNEMGFDEQGLRDLHSAVSRFLNGLEYLRVLNAHGEDSAEAKQFLNDCPEANRDRRYVLDVLKLMSTYPSSS